MLRHAWAHIQASSEPMHRGRLRPGTPSHTDVGGAPIRHTVGTVPVRWPPHTGLWIRFALKPDGEFATSRFGRATAVRASAEAPQAGNARGCRRPATEGQRLAIYARESASVKAPETGNPARAS